MSRIRTIKPEFWTSEQIVECSPMCRLMFVGMWNFCDDYGNHPASAKTVKMEIFPADDIPLETIQSYIEELHIQDLMLTYQNNNKQYWHVKGWHHQKIDKPSQKYPKFDDVNSTIIRRSFDE